MSKTALSKRTNPAADSLSSGTMHATIGGLSSTTHPVCGGSMPAYTLVEASVTEPADFAEYARVVPAIVAQYGGRYLVRGAPLETLEGTASDLRYVVHEWPDADTARRFWHSPEYTAARKLREGTGTFRILLIDGAPLP